MWHRKRGAQDAKEQVWSRQAGTSLWFNCQVPTPEDAGNIGAESRPAVSFDVARLFSVVHVVTEHLTSGIHSAMKRLPAFEMNAFSFLVRSRTFT